MWTVAVVVADVLAEDWRPGPLAGPPGVAWEQSTSVGGLGSRYVGSLSLREHPPYPSPTRPLVSRSKGSLGVADRSGGHRCALAATEIRQARCGRSPVGVNRDPWNRRSAGTLTTCST